MATKDKLVNLEDLKVVSDVVAGFKTGINVASAGKDAFSGVWELGSVSSNGGNSNTDRTIRTVGRYPYDGHSYFKFTGVVRGETDEEDRIAYVYPYDANGTYMGSEYRLLISDGVPVQLPEGTAEYRLTYGFTTASGKTVSDVAAMVADYGLDIISSLSHDLDSELSTKQDALTFDQTPAENSTNPVESGGVYSAIQSAVTGTTNALNTKINHVIDVADVDYIDFIAQPSDKDFRNVTYTWTGKTCHVVTGAGGASDTSYADIFADASHMPEGLQAGETYKVVFEGQNVEIRLYYAEDNTFISASLYKNKTSGFVTIPASATGLRARLYVLSGATVNEYVTPIITRVDVSERIVFPHRIAMFGDSITGGRDGNESAGVHTPYEIPATIAKRLGCAVDNLGVGSMGWVAEGSGMNAYDKISSTDLTPYDVITLCFGVNDGFKPIGNYDSNNETEVMGQFNKVINYIYTQKPAVQVIVIAPFNGCNVGSFPKYWYGNPGGQAYSRGTLSDTLKQACEYYNIPYIEQKNGPLNGFTIKKDIVDSDNKSVTYMGADGVHPSTAGYKAIGGWLSGEIARLIG